MIVKVELGAAQAALYVLDAGAREGRLRRVARQEDLALGVLEAEEERTQVRDRVVAAVDVTVRELGVGVRGERVDERSAGGVEDARTAVAVVLKGERGAKVVAKRERV